MLLKKIEFQGFKSFVDPTLLSFEPGISAIVGPNGCGKSNISDSIRWVLGEQSAKALRGSKMADVIFNGTDSRKPSGMAEVSLTLSNEDRKLPIDFSEVTVTRRAYRSGENEYLINKAPSRLKDITRLFSDTGVGTDGYSLLEQGKMDLILSSKPMDRRSVFEEAAGITTYKAQRDEALRKLDSTEQNLLRVNDIVQEVKRQINSLERQAKKAEKFQILKTELDGLQSRFLVREFKKNRTALAAMARELEGLRDAAQSLEAAIKEKDAAISGIQLSLIEDEASLSAATQGVHAIESEAAQIDKQVEINRSQIIYQGERKDRALAEAAAAGSRRGILEEELRVAREERESEAKALQALKSGISEAEAMLRSLSQRRRAGSDEAQTLQQRSLELMNSRSGVKAEIESFHGRTAQIESRMRQLLGELDASQSMLHQAGQMLQEAFQRVGGKKEEVRNLEDSLRDRTRRRLDLEEALRLAEEAYSAAQMVLSSEKSRLAVLEELTKALEGYEAGPKALLLQSGQGLADFPGVESLAHRVRTDPQYELAVELGLGHSLQTLLCGSVDDGLKALRWLKDNKQGRASFMVASDARVPGSVFPADLLTTDGVIGVLSDRLQADEVLKPALRWLGGRLLLVRDLETALNIRLRLPEACSAVTLEGMIVSAEGLISGGSTETSERGILGRERETEDLRRKIEHGERQLAERLSERDGLRSELSGLSTEIQKHSASLQDVQIEIAQLQKEHSSKQEDQSRLARESEEKRRSMEAADVEAAGYRARSESLERQLADMMREESTLKEALDLSLGQTDALRAEEERHQALVADIRVREASLIQRSDHLQSTVSRLESEFTSAGQQAARHEAESRQAENEQKNLAQRNETLEQQLKATFARREEAKVGVTKAAEVRQGHQGELLTLEKELRELRNELADKSESKHTQEMASQELKLKLGQVQQSLFTEFRIEMGDGAQEEISLDAPEEELSQQRLGELKEKLEELGIVNPAAAEEYRELEQRHSLLVGQVEDLRGAKINQESRERFIATFDAVHENFKRIFRTLFGGGEAKLTLMEEGDLLEAGIEIIARPPGKRQQTISLLSGGEKALTAIALLFALFECKPSPFCVLDEIDAPLDDANITRFTKLLTEYSGKSQFIVITHSKITMEKADILYGITMEEAGVSRIVSARFKEDRPMVAS
ncbi:MAG: chromosome segregation protein SMC [candidate division FCPU426 bacterium]